MRSFYDEDRIAHARDLIGAALTLADDRADESVTHRYVASTLSTALDVIGDARVELSEEEAA